MHSTAFTDLKVFSPFTTKLTSFPAPAKYSPLVCPQLSEEQAGAGDV